MLSSHDRQTEDDLSKVPEIRAKGAGMTRLDVLLPLQIAALDASSGPESGPCL